MYGYDNKELLNYFAQELSGYSVYEVQCGDPCGFIGQGISRTVFHYSKYEDIVFKIAIGEDGFDENTFYDEERIYDEAVVLAIYLYNFENLYLMIKLTQSQ